MQHKSTKMQNIFIIISLLVTLSQGQELNLCAGWSEDTGDFCYPDPEDCNAFYQCVGYIPIYQHCAPGLELSSTVVCYCDWPEKC